MTQLAGTAALLLSLHFTTPAVARAREQTRTPLDRAAATFRVADADANGVLDADEISKAAIHASAARQWDQDSSGDLSRDEFLVYYRQLLLDAGKAPGPEFEREARRILKDLASRAAERARTARERDPRGSAPPVAVTATDSTADKYRRARAALSERLRRMQGRAPSSLGGRDSGPRTSKGSSALADSSTKQESGPERPRP
jgi:hypothetical protein